MHHELKIWPQYYCRVADGSKTFEVRNNDRGFQPGDTVTLREYNPELIYTPPAQMHGLGSINPVLTQVVKRAIGFTDKLALDFKIGYVLPIENDRVVFSLLPLEESK